MKDSSSVDKAILWSRERPPTPDELKGFGPPGRKPGGAAKPYIHVHGPDKEDGPKGWAVEIGVKGTF